MFGAAEVAATAAPAPAALSPPGERLRFRATASAKAAFTNCGCTWPLENEGAVREAPCASPPELCDMCQRAAFSLYNSGGAAGSACLGYEDGPERNVCLLLAAELSNENSIGIYLNEMERYVKDFGRNGPSSRLFCLNHGCCANSPVPGRLPTGKNAWTLPLYT
jgi:hypothetical protein